MTVTYHDIEYVELPRGLGDHQLYVPVGLLLAWLVHRDLLSGKLTTSPMRPAIDEVRGRRMTGPELYERMDGTLNRQMLTPGGNSFVAGYLEHDEGNLYADLEEAFFGRYRSVYHVRDTWESYDALAPLIDARFARWEAEHPLATRATVSNPGPPRLVASPPGPYGGVAAPPRAGLAIFHGGSLDGHERPDVDTSVSTFVWIAGDDEEAYDNTGGIATLSDGRRAVIYQYVGDL